MTILSIKLKGNHFKEDLLVVKSCNGRKYNSNDKTWEVPLTKPNIIKLRKIDYLNKQIDIELEREKLKSTKINKKIEKVLEDYPFLFKYQALGAYLAFTKKRFLIADDMGLGKTVQMMPIIDKNLKRNRKVIILAPSSLILQWKSEIKRFINLDASTTIKMNKNKRLEVYRKNSLIISTYESFWRDVMNNQLELNWKEVTLITDEASKYKNNKTKLYECMDYLAEEVHSFIALSGTPVENSLINFFNIINVIKPGFMTKQEFYQHYCEWDNYGGGLVGYRNLGEFLQRVSTIMIRRTKHDVDGLPELRIQNRVIDLTVEQKNVIRGIRKFASEEENIGSLILLRGAANDTELINHSDSVLVRIMKNNCYLPREIPHSSNKLTELKGIVDELSDNQKILIFTSWSKMAKKIYKYLTIELNQDCHLLTGENSLKEREDTIEYFKKNNYKFLIATDIFGYGINLQFIDILINFDLPWNPAKLNQRIGRIHRHGSTTDKLVINLISEDIDEKVKEVLDDKQNLFDQVVDGKIISDENVRNEILKKML